MASDSPLRRILDVLESVTGLTPSRNGQGWKTRCPAHDNDDAPLLVSEGPDGKVLLRCASGCFPDTVFSKIGQRLIEVRRGEGAADDAVRTELEALESGIAFPHPDDDSWEFDSRTLEGERARNEFWAPIPASKLGGTEAVEWVWNGFVAKKHVTLFVGLWKSGKTTLLSRLLGVLGDGGELGGRVIAGRAIVITEESGSLWARRRDRIGIGDNVEFVVRPFRGKPTFSEWEKFCGEMSRLVVEKGVSLVIVDSWQSVSPVADENDAAAAMRALNPLHAISEAGAGVLLVHHSRKGDAAEGQAARGSGALAGFVDVIVELRRFTPGDNRDVRRTLTAYSRFDETPQEMVLEYGPDGYRMAGTVAHASLSDKRAAVREMLPGTPPGLTGGEILSEWIDEKVPRPGRRTVDDILQDGVNRGLWVRSGAGRKGAPFRYYRPDNADNSFLASPPPKVRETNSIAQASDSGRLGVDVPEPELADTPPQADDSPPADSGDGPADDGHPDDGGLPGLSDDAGFNTKGRLACFKR